jgi:hypothetical protein
MSKIAISGASTGTATFTIESPATSTNRTLTLPDNTGTIITQNSTPAFASTIGVGGATPSTSGAGITFPATQSASSNANTLDDYEEGSWTPNDASGAGLSFTGASGTSQYTKIGNMVFLSTEIIFPSTANGAEITIGGLPFTAAAVPNQGAFGGFIRFSDANIGFFSLATLPNATNVVTRNLSGVSIANSAYSTKRLDFVLVYKAA